MVNNKICAYSIVDFRHTSIILNLSNDNIIQHEKSEDCYATLCRLMVVGKTSSTKRGY